jgi:cytochrome c
LENVWIVMWQTQSDDGTTCDAVDRSTRVCVLNLAVGATILGVAFVLVCPERSMAAGDAARGEKIYRQCMTCHTLDKNAIGPKHRDVFGRSAGSVADYDYSAALKTSNIVWNEATLDAWLTNPQALVPGSKMFFSVGDAQDRADVIEFLKEKATTQASK